MANDHTEFKSLGQVDMDSNKIVNVTDPDDNQDAATAIDTEQTSISNATVDNSTYCYNIYTSTLDTNDTIEFVRIKYTTKYI